MFKLLCYETCYDSSQSVIEYIWTNSLDILLYIHFKTALCAIYMFGYNFVLSWVLFIYLKINSNSIEVWVKLLGLILTL